MKALIAPYDRDALRQQFQSAAPFRFFKIENFLDAGFADEVVQSYPTYEQARALGGKEFDAVNEKLKIQVTDSAQFPSPVKQLADALSGPDFLADMEYITGIPSLLADAGYSGGGMHLTNKSGRLDVHVDFNFNDQLSAFRRLNILVYLNPVWEEAWGGNIELWDSDVRKCWHSYSPIMNRCVVFETTKISYHGVTPLKCPPSMARKSFAAYYYTKEPPAGWDGVKHSTIFRARPEEKVREAILMPAENLKRGVSRVADQAKSALKGFLGRR
ncbi:MAG: 2OG-Fe(II) oxygenase [Steroidobacteraceae bacterium]